MPGGRAPRPPLPREAALGPPVAFSVAVAATERIDRFLADQLALSRTQAARLVAAGAVRVNGTQARASRLLACRDLVEVAFPESAPIREVTAHPIPLTVVYEDEHLAVIDKPAGLVVHPAPGHWDDTLVNALAARGTALSGGPPGRPGIVHRLDRDTSGLLVVARTDLAHRKLGAALAARQVHRAYATLAWGHLDRDQVSFEAPVARHATDRKRMTVRRDGRAARSDARVVARFSVCDLLRLELHSGRTHQIRVHLEHAGHPVVGDPVYGGGGARRITGPGRVVAERLQSLVPRQALHAAELRFRHPADGRDLAFRAEWPADLLPAVGYLQTVAEQVAPVQALSYFGFFESAQ